MPHMTGQESAATPDLRDIREAALRIAPLAKRTLVLTSSGLDLLCGAHLYFKCENFQRTGSFKIRGASNAILQLSEEEARHGVVTHSSGNHASAVACAAQHRGIRADIVMPENTPMVKRETTEAFGGVIHLCAPTLEARESTMNAIREKTGATLVHPYDNAHVIAGQGTATLELLDDIPDLDAVVAPVSGGGLISGTALAATSLKPGIRVIGAEPQMADDASRSFQSGKLEPLLPGRSTIADGLRATLCPRTFGIIEQHVDGILTVSEEAIIEAMKLLWRYLKIVVEPSGAVPFAVLMRHAENFAGKRVGLLLTGGNLDLDKLPSQA
jgi:threonine dehydratase